MAVVLAALALSVDAFLRAEDFLSREEIISPSILDIVVGVEDSLYPPPWMGRFDERSTIVFVYLSVEDLPVGEGTEAWAERVGRTRSSPSCWGGELDLWLSANRKIT